MLAGVAALLSGAPAEVEAGTAVAAVRMWPAPEYTRVTIETHDILGYEVFSISSPERLVIDLTDVEITPALKDVPALASPDDRSSGGALLA